MKFKSDNSETAEKIYWLMFKRFLNNKNIPITTPILVSGQLMSHFHKKTNLFNNQYIEKKILELLELLLTFIPFLFTKHCYIISNLS